VQTTREGSADRCQGEKTVGGSRSYDQKKGEKSRKRTKVIEEFSTASLCVTGCKEMEERRRATNDAENLYSGKDPEKGPGEEKEPSMLDFFRVTLQRGL